MEFPVATPDQAVFSEKTTLEDLPTEIKVMILCQMPQLSSLRSIVHASPTYHQAYCGAREEVLHAMTVRTLQEHDIGLLDPWTAVHTLQYGSHTSSVERINEQLEKYAQGCMDGSRRHLIPKDSLAILRLHGKFTDLVTKYCEDMLSKNPLTGLPDDDPLPPSPMELHRLYKTLWRYQIYSKFFGPRSLSALAPLDDRFSKIEIADNFFGLFAVYEVEELACLQKYARDYYYNHYLSARDSWYRLKQHQLVALGPEKLYDVMTAASEFECETRLAEGVDAGRGYFTMRGVLDAYERDVCLGGWQWKEVYASFHSEQMPSTGWLWASSRGVQYTDFRLRRWGYVFWDQERLDHWGITKDKMINWPRPEIISCHAHRRQAGGGCFYIRQLLSS